MRYVVVVLVEVEVEATDEDSAAMEAIAVLDSEACIVMGEVQEVREEPDPYA